MEVLSIFALLEINRRYPKYPKQAAVPPKNTKFPIRPYLNLIFEKFIFKTTIFIIFILWLLLSFS
jgi:hypothetical protein